MRAARHLTLLTSIRQLKFTELLYWTVLYCRRSLLKHLVSPVLTRIRIKTRSPTSETRLTHALWELSNSNYILTSILNSLATPNTTVLVNYKILCHIFYKCYKGYIQLFNILYIYNLHCNNSRILLTRLKFRLISWSLNRVLN